MASPAPAPSPENKKACRKTASRFPDFWSVYPKREAKADAAKAWSGKSLDKLADEIISDVVLRKVEHRAWRDGFIPLAASYLRGERWTDDIDRSPPRDASTGTKSDRSAPRLPELT